ncbi:MAG TPA: UDP-N-acetylmuramoyl-L-alanyl-D-glutamate--2,6-diaminopimelate ligase [Terriglobales bacterium]|nr:UDP-N-acetylmuramoyl-L-alanyl-D-glutamate--2,6-diaminopimelate ligase [Terriglobales bacterium]
MKFLELLDGVELTGPGVRDESAERPEITGIEYDSRRVTPGSLFVAMRGETSDGNRFIDQAIARGAVAVVTDSDPEPKGVDWARVAHGRQALATLSANFYGQPAKKLGITGITGTNGKSTTAFLVEAILRAADRAGALVGTIEYHVGGKVLPAPHTTPESLELQRLFCETVASGGTEVVMEVSSHALAQGRTYGIPFDVAVFTNLTRDHLDFHKSMDEYFAAKKILFSGCGSPRPRQSVLNADDEYGVQLAEFGRQQGSKVFTYGWSKADFRAGRVEITARGTQFQLNSPEGSIEISSSLIGRVNVYNILAASAAAVARGCSLDAVAQGVATLKSVPGRFERVDCGQSFTVVVDYAHTDDALRNLTSLARDFVKQNSGRVITVFGCGGDRDRTKRPLMGEAAGQGSDFVVLTSDNPRSEDPLAIMNDAVVGLQRSGVRYKSEPDRHAAIALAIGEARSGDIVLIAGKGHEKFQISRGGTIRFDDREVAANVLYEFGYQKLSNQEGIA